MLYVVPEQNYPLECQVIVKRVPAVRLQCTRKGFPVPEESREKDCGLWILPVSR